MRKLEERLQKHVDLLVKRYPTLKGIEQSIIDAYLIMEECYENGGKILIAGNGGSAADSEHMANMVEDTNGCYVVPAFTGLGAPHWDQYARGCIVGLTRGCNKAHIIRATVESLAYQTYDILEAMQADAGVKLAALKVDGGACKNDFLMQFQADIIDAPVHRPQCVETTAMGAAYLAGLAVGYWNSKEDVIANWAIDKVFDPEMDDDNRKKLLKGWKKAVKCSYGWAKED